MEFGIVFDFYPYSLDKIVRNKGNQFVGSVVYTSKNPVSFRSRR